MSSKGVGPSRARQLLDAAVYALAVVCASVSVSAVVAVVAFGDAGGGVVLLTFVLGWLIAGYGVAKLWPSAAWKSRETEEGVEIAETRTDPETGTTEAGERTTLQTAVQEVPPLDRYALPPGDRLSTGTKTFLAGVAVLLTSLGIDYVLHW